MKSCAELTAIFSSTPTKGIPSHLDRVAQETIYAHACNSEKAYLEKCEEEPNTNRNLYSYAITIRIVAS
jgi:hypothetical protein